MFDVEDIDSETTIDRIQKVYNQFYNIWSGIKFDDVEKIRDVWTDDVGKLFVDKLMEVNHQVNDILNELDNLKDCWSRYLAKESNQGTK